MKTTEQRIQKAREEGRSLWVKAKKGGIIGYLLPTGELVRLTNAGHLYALAQARHSTVDLLYQITTGNACFGLVVRNGIITEAAPIARGAIGKRWEAVRAYYKGATIEEVR